MGSGRLSPADTPGGMRDRLDFLLNRWRSRSDFAVPDISNPTQHTRAIPKSDSKSHRSASAANAGVFLQLAISKANRRGTPSQTTPTPVSRRFTSDTALGVIGQYSAVIRYGEPQRAGRPHRYPVGLAVNGRYGVLPYRQVCPGLTGSIRDCGRFDASGSWTGRLVPPRPTSGWPTFRSKRCSDMISATYATISAAG